MERVSRIAAMGGRIGERADDLQELHHRTGPAMCENQRSRLWLGDRTCMKWMSSPPIPVVNCGSAFSPAPHARQSYSVAE